MNNTRYYDLVEDLCPAAARGDIPSLISAEYPGELRMGKRWQSLGGRAGKNTTSAAVQKKMLLEYGWITAASPEKLHMKILK